MKKQFSVSPISVLLVILISGVFYSIALSASIPVPVKIDEPPKIVNPIVCGDGELETGEQCDDGNTSNVDACLNSCLNASCGDGYVRTGVEDCDDGNTANGDGCSSTCAEEQQQQNFNIQFVFDIMPLVSDRYSVLQSWSPDAEVGFVSVQDEPLSYITAPDDLIELCLTPPCDDPPISNVVPTFSGLKLGGYIIPDDDSFIEPHTLAILGNIILQGTRTISAGPENSSDPVIIDDDLEVTDAIRADEIGKFYDWDSSLGDPNYDTTYAFADVVGTNKIFQTFCDTGDIAVQCGGFMCPDSAGDKYLGSFTYGSMCQIFVYDGGGSVYATDAAGNNTTIGCGDAGSALVDVTCFSPDGGFSKTL
ncbi:DUF4215 domain-containing protein [Patescibacteria group bacterium]